MCNTGIIGFYPLNRDTNGSKISTLYLLHENSYLCPLHKREFIVLYYVALAGRILLLGTERVLVKKLGTGADSASATFIFMGLANFFLLPVAVFYGIPSVEFFGVPVLKRVDLLFCLFSLCKITFHRGSISCEPSL